MSGRQQLWLSIAVGLGAWVLMLVAIVHARYGYAALFLAYAGCGAYAFDGAVKRITWAGDDRG